GRPLRSASEGGPAAADPATRGLSRKKGAAAREEIPAPRHPALAVRAFLPFYHQQAVLVTVS
ncbi:MAG: hypothetical protein AB1816_18320, partial [Bacillota bacterium]